MKKLISLIVLALTVLASQAMELPQAELDRQLRVAAIKNDVEKMKQVLHAGANVNATNYRGLTPLHWAASRNNKEAMELLLARADVDVNALDDVGQTPLDFAAIENNQKAIELLLASEYSGLQTGKEKLLALQKD